MIAAPNLISIEAALLCAGLAAVTDLRSRRIPNWLTGCGFLTGMALHLTLGGFREAGTALLAGLIGGGIFFLFFLAGGMGAGDVKLMAAVGTLAGIGSLETILIATALLGAAGAFVIALSGGRLAELLLNSRALLAHHQAHGLVHHPELNVSNPSTMRMPYAIPIAGGCLIALFHVIRGGYLL